MKSKGTSCSKLSFLREDYYQRWCLVLVFLPKYFNFVNVFKFSVEITKMIIFYKYLLLEVFSFVLGLVCCFLGEVFSVEMSICGGGCYG